MIKKLLFLLAIVVLLASAGAAGFYGGITYQSNKINQAQNNFLTARGPAGGQFENGQPPDGSQLPQGGQFPGGRQSAGFVGNGATGQVKSIDGNVLTLSTAQDIQTITLTDSTRIQQYTSAGAGDLEPGLRVMVTGEQDADGNLTASQITILNADFPEPMAPQATGTAP